MTEAILVINAGSSSIKFSLFELAQNTPRLRLHGQVEGIYTAPTFLARSAAGETLSSRAWPAGTPLGHDGAIAHIVEYLRGELAQVRLLAAGHRVVHGGMAFGAPVRVDDATLEKLAALIPLAPLHQPHNLAAIRALGVALPALPQIACFDTAFHRSMPEVAQAYALPASITRMGVRRYGFHGLSFEYICAALSQVDVRAAAGRVVVAHLGNGASMCAILGGGSVASTMGLTALDGLPMGTRCGSIDPGVLLYLLREGGLDVPGLERLLYHQSGLLGVSGVSSDMRALLASSESSARFAIDLFVYRIGRELGSLVSALGGIDALVFTGGIGEHASAIRERVLQDASWLGFEVDAAANTAGAQRISVPNRGPAAYVMATDEELMIARHVVALLEART
ncbi:MAG: acetate/propionate family kinase [Pseudomonadota bacterium]|nr:acetate/propionate family kinase [Pseudomonadota bacterium]